MSADKKRLEICQKASQKAMTALVDTLTVDGKTDSMEMSACIASLLHATMCARVLGDKNPEENEKTIIELGRIATAAVKTAIEIDLEELERMYRSSEPFVQLGKRATSTMYG